MPAVCLLLIALAAAPADRPGRKRTTLERIEPERLAAVHEARQRFARDRAAFAPLGIYQDFRAVIHVHAEDSDHTGGTRAQVLEAAKTTGVQVVMFTDHRGPKPETWRGLRDGVLFMPGSEDPGLLRFPAPEPELRFLSHPEERLDAPVAGLDGMEIYNRHTDALDDDEFRRHFQAAMKNPEQWAKLASAYRKYPDEFFAAPTDAWPELLQKFDREAQKRPLTAIAANDSHRNQLYRDVLFDPYEVSFRNVTTHVLARELSEEQVRQSLREGHAYVAHDWLCDPAGFAFAATNNLGVFETGDAVPLFGRTRLLVQLPLAARLKVYRNGELVHQAEAARLDLPVTEPGAYRVEAWLPVDGEKRPWIFSNPVYLERPAPDLMRLPSSDLSAGVEAHRDIAYTQGKPEDAPKHKLDIYLPKGRKKAPVLVFIHGGSWRSGDRAQYAPVGNRFAREGIVTVAISYRLAPKDPHPAQIEDAAAALAWVVRNIKQHGGDPKRIYLGGHSAGAHLAALLALDPRYLKHHGLAPKAIRGVVALSGPYDIRSQESVFGKDPAVRRDASPLAHVNAKAPPFLVTYCQWDYLTLPAQARQFHAALGKAGVRSRLVFVPRQSHISEMVNIVKEDDPSARAVREFIQH